MGIANVQAVGTAVTNYGIPQKEIKEFVATFFHSHVDHLERLLPVFENSLIETRYLSQPLEWYETAHSFAESNAIFEQVALELAEKAALRAMTKAKVQSEEIGMVIFVSSTGITTPSLDAKLIHKLGLSPHTKRLPIWGLGCAGGVAGLARSFELAPSIPNKSILLVTVELCSLTFQKQDYSKSNLIGTSLFADGAAAALIRMDSTGPGIIHNYSTLLPDSTQVMGWDLTDTGLKVRFSRDIPSIVKGYLPGLLKNACEEWGIREGEIYHYVVHPGGAKVLSAYEESLNLSEHVLRYGYDILARYGNMSSASILFVLEKFMEEVPAKGKYGVLLALGPGFSVEEVLFQW